MIIFKYDKGAGIDFTEMTVIQKKRPNSVETVKDKETTPRDPNCVIFLCRFLNEATILFHIDFR